MLIQTNKKTNFTENVARNPKETILDFSRGTVKVLKNCFRLI